MQACEADLYHAYTPADRGDPYGVMRSETAGRFVPELAVEWRYPLITRIGSLRQLIEPIVQGVISPDGGNPHKIPNEDSRDLEFDHTNLFSTNRHTGLDRIETGPRVNYGVRLGFYGPGGGRATALIGQSARAKDDSPFRARQRPRRSDVGLRRPQSTCNRRLGSIFPCGSVSTTVTSPSDATKSTLPPVRNGCGPGSVSPMWTGRRKASLGTSSG